MCRKFVPVAIIGVLAMAATMMGREAEDSGDSMVGKKPFGQHKTDSGSSTPQILWHGGPVLGIAGSVTLYVIYYGSNWPSTTQPLINAFLGGLSGTPQFNVNKTYCEKSTTACSASDSPFGGLLGYNVDATHVFHDAAVQGNTVNSSGISKILQYALVTAPGHLPLDSNGIYMLVTDPTINVPGFGTSFCAYHTRSNVAGNDIKWALIPEPGSKGASCDGNIANGQTVTPNGDAGADEMIDSIMHELSETVSDPDLNAWYTSNGSENGDLCDYNYGTWASLPEASNGAKYNAAWGGHHWLIQLIWKNTVTAGCASQ
jgi:hypothetical protein